MLCYYVSYIGRQRKYHPPTKLIIKTETTMSTYKHHTWACADPSDLVSYITITRKLVRKFHYHGRCRVQNAIVFRTMNKVQFEPMYCHYSEETAKRPHQKSCMSRARKNMSVCNAGGMTICWHKLYLPIVRPQTVFAECAAIIKWPHKLFHMHIYIERFFLSAEFNEFPYNQRIAFLCAGTDDYIVVTLNLEPVWNLI